MNVCIRTLTASLALLGLSGAAALAQQSSDTTTTPRVESGDPAQSSSGTAQAPMTGGQGSSDSAQSGTAADQGSTGMAQTPTAGGQGDAGTSAQHYGSYEAQGDGFAGAIAGGYTAEELMGKDVVGPEDDTIASISDLLIGENDQIDKVVLDIGGFLGMGAKSVAVDIEQLQPAAEGEEFQIGMTRDELEAMPEYERADDGWSMM